MRITVEIPESEINEICLATGERKKGPAIRKLVTEALRMKRRAVLAQKFIDGDAGVELNSLQAKDDAPVVSKNLPLIKLRPAEPIDARSLTQQEWCDWLKEVELQLDVERYEKALGHQHVDRAVD